MSYQNQDHWQFDDAIAQADWLTSQSGYDDLNDLWLSDPDLYTTLAREWREDNPLNNLGG